MEVIATSKIPGTNIHERWDRKVIYSNVQHPSPPLDTWTPVTLRSTQGNKIQWLWFQGHLAIDNFKVTRKPLNCTPTTVQRGQQVRCEVVLAGGWSVTGWTFQPDDASIPVVQETSSNKEWKGIAAAPGTVTVQATNGTATRAYKVPVKVTDRPSAWSSRWGYREGPELNCGRSRASSRSGRGAELPRGICGSGAMC